jgi:hypothetical protein
MWERTRAAPMDKRIVTKVPRHLVEEERAGFHLGTEPKDAATLIVTVLGRNVSCEYDIDALPVVR